MGRHFLFLAGISASAFATSVVQAQTGPTPDAQDEIVVTALGNRQSLNDAPASITAFDAKALQITGVTRAEQFVKLTPGVTIVTGAAEAADTQINIRGINGARDAESSVALVVDGILKTNVAALNQDQGTLTQIEVLKGPQGAIYGRNATAGAIVIQTRKPSDHLEGGIKASYANEQSFTGSAFLSAPIAEGIGFVLSGDYRTTDGFFRNAYLDNRKVVDYQEAWNVNGRIVAELGDTTIDAKGKYGKLDGASINYNAVFALPGFAAALGPDFYAQVDDHRFGYYNNIKPTNSQETIEASLKIDHDFGPATLSAWAAYSKIDNKLVADGTSADFQRFTSAVNPAVQSSVDSCFSTTAALAGYPLNSPTFIAPSPFASVFGSYAPVTCDGSQYQRRQQEDGSAEIRLTSNGDGPLQWQLGGYYLHINRKVLVNLMADQGLGVLETSYAPPDSISPSTQIYHDKFTTNVYAAFASGKYAVTDALKLGVALRYDIEDRKVDNLVPVVFDPFTGAPINPGQTAGAVPSKKATFKQLEPKIDLSYKFGREATVYANWGVGFKSGGFNNQGAAALVASNFNAGLGSEVQIDDQYKKERSSAFEAGVKGQVGPLTYSLAGYYTRVTNMQFFEFFVGSFGLLRVVSNIDRVDLKGLEANGALKVVNGWTLFASGNYTDSEIKKNTSRPSTVGNKSPYTAKYTINLGSQMEAPIASTFDLLLRADYRITGPTWFHTVQGGAEYPTLFGAPAMFDRTKRSAYGVLDLRLGLQSENWNATLFANNALNRKYLNDVTPAIEFGGSFVAPGARRLYGVELGYRF
ncbi:MAG: TonB-dependent receptor [Alphaproteobacteria bacterium]|nr:MAG: TonB-dependent receptor [Alphaproteobacteria bacterium]